MTGGAAHRLRGPGGVPAAARRHRQRDHVTANRRLRSSRAGSPGAGAAEDTGI